MYLMKLVWRSPVNSILRAVMALEVFWSEAGDVAVAPKNVIIP
jgi:hypothetical protein